MKYLRSISLISLFALALVFVTGCDREQGFVFEPNVARYVEVDGSEQRVALDGDHLAIARMTDGKIKLESKEVKGMFDWRVTDDGKRSTVDALSTMLSDRRQSYEFDFTTQRLEWSADVLKLVDRATKEVKLELNMKDVLGLVIFDENGGERVSFAAYGGTPCKDLVDVDEYVMTDSVGGPSHELHFEVCDEQLVGARWGESGGIYIVVVDPAIVDDDWSKAGFNPAMLDEKLTSYRKQMRMSDGGSVFIGIEEMKLSNGQKSGSLPNPAIKPKESPTARRCGLLEAPKYVTMLEVPGRAEIERCDAIFTVMDQQRNPLLRLDCRQCGFQIKIDSLADQTRILADSSCMHLLKEANIY